MARAPTIAPLDGPAELAARRTITTALVEARWSAGSWTDAERLAADLLDRLRADHLELLKVSWP